VHVIRLVAVAGVASGCIVTPAVECPRAGPVRRLVITEPRFVGMEAREAHRVRALLHAKLREADVVVREPKEAEGAVPCRESSCAPQLARADGADATLLVRLARVTRGILAEHTLVDATGQVLVERRFPVEQRSPRETEAIVEDLLARAREPQRVRPLPGAPPRFDRWYTLQGNAAVQIGGADADYGGVVYLGWTRGSLDPDRDRPATEESPFWGVGLELVTSACASDGEDACPARTSLGPAVRAGIAWVKLPQSLAHIYIQASGLLGHEHGREAGIQGAGVRGSAGFSLLPLAAIGASSSDGLALLLLLSHIEASFEAYRPSGGSLASGFGVAFGFGF
jgi:hypothetical protein